MFSRFIITNTMLDFLVFLLDIPSLLADFSPRAKHKGESPYWRFMGLFLLTAELVILFLWDITESLYYFGPLADRAPLHPRLQEREKRKRPLRPFRSAIFLTGATKK